MEFPEVLCNIISEYAESFQLIENVKTCYPDINMNEHICHNSSDGALDIIESTPSIINLDYLTTNKNDRAIDILKHNVVHIKNNYKLYNNVNSRIMEVIKLLDNIDIGSLSIVNSDDAMDIILQNQDKINWRRLSMNTNGIALKLLEQNPDKIDWCMLSLNSNDMALDLLEHNQDKIDWSMISRNPNNRAIILLKQNIHKINWSILCTNTNDMAVDLVLQNAQHVFKYLKNIKLFCSNPNDKAVDFLINNKVYGTPDQQKNELLKHYAYNILFDYNWIITNTNSKISYILQNMNSLYFIHDWDVFIHNPAIYKSNKLYVYNTLLNICWDNI